MEQYTAIFARIYKAIKDEDGPIIVGISGAYTSGKTMFTKGLSEYLTELGIQTQIIHYDDFHNPLMSISWDTGNQDSEIDAFYSRAFNTQKLIDEVLNPLTNKRILNTTIKGLNWGTGLYENAVRLAINEQTVTILEGALLFQPQLIPYLSYRIFLDVDESEILRRGEIRDVPKSGVGILEKYKMRYLPVHRRYLAEDQPEDKANLIIDNNDYFAPKVIKDAF